MILLFGVIHRYKANAILRFEMLQYCIIKCYTYTNNKNTNINPMNLK